MTDPIFISVAPNGARKTHAMLPQIPLSPEELAIEAVKCRDAGTVLLHLHIRDEEEKHSLDIARYRAAISAIRDAVGDSLIIQTTTEAVGIYTPEQQIAVLHELVPEAASIAIRELIPDPSYEAQAKACFAWAAEQGIFVQYILYSPEEVRYFASLKERGIIPAGKSFILCVLGKKHAAPNDAAAYAQPSDLTPFTNAYHETLQGTHTEWAVCAFGGNENACMLEAVRHGGHVRIGFENNHLLHDQSIAPDNASLIRQFVTSVKEHVIPRSIADIHTARKMFNLRPVRHAA